MAEMTLSHGAVDFIDDAKLAELARDTRADRSRVREIIAKSLAKQPLTVADTAALLADDSPEIIEEIFAAARQLKRDVYGNRIVIFAPLYIGNNCVNDCAYCSFKRSNLQQVRRTLTHTEISAQVREMERRGHKRMIIVFGEHPDYGADFIADCVRTVYDTFAPEVHGEIRRVNVNAAPQDIEGYRLIKQSHIGTFQIFHETYHHATYARLHPPRTRKADYLWRLDGLSRAMEAGLDDVGIGALFGLYDWKFEVLGLVSHALHLQDRYNCGPHTISFPRIQPAAGVDLNREHVVCDRDFKRLIAVLRLAVPYTGLICTARENPQFRREVMDFGVSQIDAGSRIEIGGYTETGDSQVMEREQFQLGDIRPLDTVTRELMQDGYVPSFCTACYRLGRTGEHFMEFAIPGFIKRFCTPNALSTLQEYLVDCASPETRVVGEKLIQTELDKLPDSPQKQELTKRLELIRTTEKRDFYF
jgi:2-iminoacetate synthase